MRKTLLALLALIPSLAWAADPVPQPLPYVFQPNTTAASAQVNADLNYIVNNINNWAASGVGVGTITGVTAGTGLSGGGTSGSVTLSLANTAVTPASYTCATITVDQQGRLTAASSTTCGGGSGTVTSVTTSGAVTSSPATITSTGTISLAPIISGNIIGNSGASTVAPTSTTLTALIDRSISSTQGVILYRGASLWSALAPGTSGQFLKTLGASANPAWASAGTVTSITSGTGISTTPSTITGTGVIGLIVPVTVANGGTNATAAGATAANNIGALAQANNLSDVSSASTARSNILAAASGANSDITSLSGLTTPLSVPQGGTGGVTFTAHAPIIGEGTSAHTSTAVGTTGQALLSGGSSADPAYGTLGVAGGGTGDVSLTAHGVLVGAGTSSVAVTSAGTSGQVLTSNGASADPTFQSAATGTVTSISAGAGLTATPAPITGSGTISMNVPVVVSNGGTGQTTLTTHGVVVGNSTSGVNVTSVGTSGQLLIGQGASADPTFNSASGDVTITNSGATTVGKIGGASVTPATWTPSDGSGASLSISNQGVSSTQVGNMVYVYGQVGYPVTASGANAQINGFPVTVANAQYGNAPSIVNQGGCAIAPSSIVALPVRNTTHFSFFTLAGVQLTNANLSTCFLQFMIIYPAT